MAELGKTADPWPGDPAERVLIAHQRLDIRSCLCGWAELGLSHAAHQVDELRRAGLLR